MLQKLECFFLREYMQVNALSYLRQSLGKQDISPQVHHVWNGCLDDFKFAETSSKFLQIL